MRGNIIPSAVLTQWHRLRVVLPSRQCPSHKLKKTEKSVKKIYCFAPCKVIQDSIRFWIPRCGFRIPGAGFRILPVQIPDSKTQNIPDFSFWFSPNFCISFSRNDFNSEFRNWRTCCVNACLSIHISMTTFDNYKKYITANQEINFSSKNTYWDCPFLKSNVHSFHIFLATLKRCTIFLSFRFLKVLQVI